MRFFPYRKIDTVKESLWPQFVLGLNEQGGEIAYDARRTPHLLVITTEESDTTALKHALFSHALQYRDKWHVSFFAVQQETNREFRKSKYEAEGFVSVSSGLEQIALRLKSMYELMDARFQLMEEYGVNNHRELPESYGVLAHESHLLVFDELADLLPTGSDEDSKYRKRIQKYLRGLAGRPSVGIYVVATVQPALLQPFAGIFANFDVRVALGEFEPEILRKALNIHEDFAGVTSDTSNHAAVKIGYHAPEVIQIGIPLNKD